MLYIKHCTSGLISNGKTVKFSSVDLCIFFVPFCILIHDLKFLVIIMRYVGESLHAVSSVNTTQLSLPV